MANQATAVKETAVQEQARQQQAAEQHALEQRAVEQQQLGRAEQLTLEPFPCPTQARAAAPSTTSPEPSLEKPSAGKPSAGKPSAGKPPPSTSEIAGSSIEVRRSKRRRRTVSAYREGDRTIVLLPARMTRAEEKHWIAEMVARLEAQDRRARPSDKKLLARAQRLSTKYLGGDALPASVKWVDNQKSRWGSCTIDDKSIRLSTRLQGMPEWVVDYVLLHELAHLIEPSHDERFWRLLNEYPLTERARGFLDGWSASCQTHGIDA